MIAPVWRGHLTYTDERDDEHRLIRTDGGWKLIVADRATGKHVRYTANGATTIAAALKLDEECRKREQEMNRGE